MASKLGSSFDSFDEWVKLGVIIHYETNGSDEGLELFDKLSQTFDKYDGVQAVSKQYYTCKYTKSNAVKIGSLYKWFYDAFPEEKELMHKIKQGKTAHFFIHDIIEDAQPFVMKNTLLNSTPKVKDVSNSLNLTTNLKEIERMASKLGSFFDSFDEWVKLGMIIHYETNGSDEGL